MSASWAATASECSTASRISTPSSTRPNGWCGRPAGSIALITQSGTVGAVFLERLSGAGIRKFVSYGNRIDVDEGDLLAYLADDPATKVIACYVEGLEDGRKFLSVAG